MMKHTLHIVLNPFVHDSRVLKQTKSLNEQGFSVTVFCTSDKGLPDTEQLSATYAIRRFRVGRNKKSKGNVFKILNYVYRSIKMIFVGIRLKPNYVHAHDLNALPIGYIISKITSAKLIYDSHEYWADSSHRKSVSALVFKVSRIVEKFFSKYADSVITVSDSIASAMYRDLKLQHMPTVIRNIPSKNTVTTEGSALRSKLSISNDKIVILYQGSITAVRGIFMLLDSFDKVKNEETVLVYMGDGPDVDKLKQRIVDLGLSSFVVHYPAVSSRELPLYTSGADIGVHPMFGGFLNHEYALPNKLFEYIQSGLCVLVSDLVEMKQLVSQYDVGQVFIRDNSIDLEDKLSYLIANKSRVSHYKSMAIRAAEELNWEEEEKKLFALYASKP